MTFIPLKLPLTFQGFRNACFAAWIMRELSTPQHAITIPIEYIFRPTHLERLIVDNSELFKNPIPIFCDNFIYNTMSKLNISYKRQSRFSKTPFKELVRPLLLYSIVFMRSIICGTWELGNIFNCDQTPIFKYISLLYSYQIKGISTDFNQLTKDKDRFTFMATICASGEAVFPYFLFKGASTNVVHLKIQLDSRIYNDHEYALLLSQISPEMYNSLFLSYVTQVTRHAHGQAVGTSQMTPRTQQSVTHTMSNCEIVSTQKYSRFDPQSPIILSLPWLKDNIESPAETEEIPAEEVVEDSDDDMLDTSAMDVVLGQNSAIISEEIKNHTFENELQLLRRQMKGTKQGVAAETIIPEGCTSAKRVSKPGRPRDFSAIVGENSDYVDDSDDESTSCTNHASPTITVDSDQTNRANNFFRYGSTKSNSKKFECDKSCVFGDVANLPRMILPDKTEFDNLIRGDLTDKSDGELLEIMQQELEAFTTYMDKKSGENIHTERRHEVDECYIAHNQNGYFNDHVTVDYLARVILESRRKPDDRMLVILDYAPCHLTDRVTYFCKEHKIDLLFVPRNATKFAQPLDVMVNHPIKQNLRNYHLNVLMNRKLGLLGSNDAAKFDKDTDYVLASLRAFNAMKPGITNFSFLKTMQTAYKEIFNYLMKTVS